MFVIRNINALAGDWQEYSEEKKRKELWNLMEK